MEVDKIRIEYFEHMIEWLKPFADIGYNPYKMLLESYTYLSKVKDAEIAELKMEDKIIGLTKSIRDHNGELSFGTIRTLKMIDDVSKSHETEIKLLKKRTRKYCDRINEQDEEIEELKAEQGSIDKNNLQEIRYLQDQNKELKAEIKKLEDEFDRFLGAAKQHINCLESKAALTVVQNAIHHYEEIARRKSNEYKNNSNV